MRHRHGDEAHARPSVTLTVGTSRAGVVRPHPPHRRPTPRDFLDRHARAEVTLLYPAGVSETTILHSVGHRVLARGVRVRAVCDRQLTTEPATRRALEEQRGRGVRLRVARRPLSHYLAVVDGDAVLVAGALTPQAVTVTRDTALVSAMSQLFQHAWLESAPWQHACDPPRDLLSEQPYAEVIRLLSEGLSDEDAAHELQVSIRTFRRYVAHIKESLHARNRFQAAVRVARLAGH